jgi:hypothetical protein
MELTPNTNFWSYGERARGSQDERELKFASTAGEHLGATKENDESYALAKDA